MTSIKDTHFATKEALLRHVSERSSLQMVAVAVVESKNDRHGNVRMIKFGCRYHDLFCKKSTDDSPPPPRKRARDSKDKSSSNNNNNNHNHNHNHNSNNNNNNNSNNECPFFWVASHCNGDWYLDPFVDTHSHPQPTRLEMEQALLRELLNYSANNEIVFKPSEETPMEAVSPVPAPLDLQPVETSVPTPPKEPIVEAKPIVETKPVSPKPNTTPAPETPPQKPPTTIMTPNLTRALDLAKVLVASITGSTPPTTNDARQALAEEILQILDRENAVRPLSKEMNSLKVSVQSLRQKVMPLVKAPPNVSTSGSAASSLPSPPAKPCEAEVVIKTAPSGPTMVKST